LALPRFWFARASQDSSFRRHVWLRFRIDRESPMKTGVFTAFVRIYAGG